MCNFSLGFRVFGQSDRFGPRSRVVLHIEDYTWVPVLGVFDKLREVGVYPTYFTLCLSVFMMLKLIEAVSGRLISLKNWDRIVGIVELI